MSFYKANLPVKANSVSVFGNIAHLIGLFDEFLISMSDNYEKFKNLSFLPSSKFSNLVSAVIEFASHRRQTGRA